MRPVADPVPLLLRPAEVAELLGMSRSKVYGLIADGKLPGIVRSMGSIRVSRVALERWIDEQASLPRA